MDHIETDEYLVRLLDHDNEEELREVQRLRYEFLLKRFDEKKNDRDGLDDDGWDAFSDSILAIKKRTGRIIGTYRVATEKTLQGRPYKSEEEFDISSLKADPEGIIEASRVVIHPEHQNGGILGLLWRGVVSYARDQQLRYIFGTCSLHGTDPNAYTLCTSVLNQHYRSDKHEVRATHNAFAYGTEQDLTMSQAGMPGLLRVYLKIGAKVSQNGFIDYDFNCCDVMIIMDRLNMNERYFKRFLS
ncbi:MAG: GNAT family N-acetyltransferase [Clostridia bacterium]|nr:GNAT family N-acetyltransferase [Clostridia bacterium]